MVLSSWPSKRRSKTSGKSRSLYPPFHVNIKDPVGYEERENVAVDPQNINELENSRGEAHFTVKFEGQMKQSSIVVLDEVKGVFKKEASIHESQGGRFVPIRGFECRNVDITGFDKFSESSGSGGDRYLQSGHRFWTSTWTKTGTSIARKAAKRFVIDVEYEFRVEKAEIVTIRDAFVNEHLILFAIVLYN